MYIYTQTQFTLRSLPSTIRYFTNRKIYIEKYFNYKKNLQDYEEMRNEYSYLFFYL